MPTFATTIDIEDAEVDVIVEYSTVEASGDGWNEPHEPAHLIIERVTTTDGEREIVLTSKEEAALEDAIAEAMDGYDEGPPDSYNAEYDDHYGGE